MCFPNVHSFTFRFADPFSLSSVQLSDSQNIPHILLFFVILLFVLYPHTFFWTLQLSDRCFRTQTAERLRLHPCNRAGMRRSMCPVNSMVDNRPTL